MLVDLHRLIRRLWHLATSQERAGGSGALLAINIQACATAMPPMLTKYSVAKHLTLEKLLKAGDLSTVREHCLATVSEIVDSSLN